MVHGAKPKSRKLENIICVAINKHEYKYKHRLDNKSETEEK